MPESSTISPRCPSPGARSSSVDESAEHHHSTLQADETREAMRTSPPRQNTHAFTFDTYTHSYIHTYLPSLYSDLAQSPNSGAPFFFFPFFFFGMSKRPHAPHPQSSHATQRLDAIRGSFFSHRPSVLKRTGILGHPC